MATMSPAKVCPRCGDRPRHVTRSGKLQGYCLECAREVSQAYRSTPEGKAKMAALVRAWTQKRTRVLKDLDEIAADRKVPLAQDDQTAEAKWALDTLAWLSELIDESDSELPGLSGGFETTRQVAASLAGFALEQGVTDMQALKLRMAIQDWDEPGGQPGLD